MVIRLFTVVFAFWLWTSQCFAQISAGYLSVYQVRRNEFMLQAQFISPDTLPGEARVIVFSPGGTPLLSLEAKKLSQSLLDTSNQFLSSYGTRLNLPAVPFLGYTSYGLGLRFETATLEKFFFESRLVHVSGVVQMENLTFNYSNMVGSYSASQLSRISIVGSSADSLSFELVAPRLSTGAIDPDYRFPDDRLFCDNCRLTINAKTGKFEAIGNFKPGVYSLYVRIYRWRRNPNKPALPLGYTTCQLNYQIR